MSEEREIIINEGMTKKGVVNNKPQGKRPNDPKGQGMYMSEEIKPQVGDVWEGKATGSNIKINAVGNIKVLYESEPVDEREMCIKGLCKIFTLKERDGKPYTPVKVFEEGAWYQGLLKTGIDDIGVVFQYQYRRFHIGGVLFTKGNGEKYSESDFSYIGDKLDIQWPEVEL